MLQVRVGTRCCLGDLLRCPWPADPPPRPVCLNFPGCAPLSWSLLFLEAGGPVLVQLRWGLLCPERLPSPHVACNTVTLHLWKGFGECARVGWCLQGREVVYCHIRHTQLSPEVLQVRFRSLGRFFTFPSPLLRARPAYIFVPLQLSVFCCAAHPIPTRSQPLLLCLLFVPEPPKFVTTHEFGQITGPLFTVTFTLAVRDCASGPTIFHYARGPLPLVTSQASRRSCRC
jgi:hypothetical protein